MSDRRVIRGEDLLLLVKAVHYCSRQVTYIKANIEALMHNMV